MSKVTLDLASDTAPGWAAYIVEHFDAFLADHANLERKASAQVMSLVVKYSDRTEMLPTLIELAQEELDHFREVYALMEKRGLQLLPDTKDPYVNDLISECRSGREERFLDRMLINSIIETRGAERFRLITKELEDPELSAFYRGLWASEARHGNVFVELSLNYFSPEVLYPRLEELLKEEARILESMEWRPSLH